MKNCKHCGNSFKPYRQNVQIYCSADCRKAVFSDKQKERWATDKEFRESKDVARRKTVVKSPESRMFSRAKHRAAKKGIEFTITLADIVFPADKKCPVLGIPLLPEGTGIDLPKDNTYSLDRMDNTKGYIPGNVRVISTRANMLKNCASVSEVRKIYRYMIYHKREQENGRTRRPRNVNPTG